MGRGEAQGTRLPEHRPTKAFPLRQVVPKPIDQPPLNPEIYHRSDHNTGNSDPSHCKEFVNLTCGGEGNKASGLTLWHNDAMI